MCSSDLDQRLGTTDSTYSVTPFPYATRPVLALGRPPPLRGPPTAHAHPPPSRNNPNRAPRAGGNRRTGNKAETCLLRGDAQIVRGKRPQSQPCVVGASMPQSRWSEWLDCVFRLGRSKVSPCKSLMFGMCLRAPCLHEVLCGANLKQEHNQSWLSSWP